MGKRSQRCLWQVVCAHAACGSGGRGRGQRERKRTHRRDGWRLVPERVGHNPTLQPLLRKPQPHGQRRSAPAMHHQRNSVPLHRSKHSQGDHEKGVSEESVPRAPRHFSIAPRRVPAPPAPAALRGRTRSRGRCRRRGLRRRRRPGGRGRAGAGPCAGRRLRHRMYFGSGFDSQAGRGAPNRAYTAAYHH